MMLQKIPNKSTFCGLQIIPARENKSFGFCASVGRPVGEPVKAVGKPDKSVNISDEDSVGSRLCVVTSDGSSEVVGFSDGSSEVVGFSDGSSEKLGSELGSGSGVGSALGEVLGLALG